MAHAVLGDLPALAAVVLFSFAVLGACPSARVETVPATVCSPESGISIFVPLADSPASTFTRDLATIV